MSEFDEDLECILKKYEQRLTWDEYFKEIVQVTAKRSPCCRLHVGCLFVKDNRIISQGYNGYLPGCEHRSILREGHEQATVHAEQNAIISAARSEMIGSTLYLQGRDEITKKFIKAEPCLMCKKMIINAGIEYVCTSKNTTLFVKFWL